MTQGTTTVDQGTPAASDAGGLELSVVMPCLNEADTLATCIRKASAPWRARDRRGGRRRRQRQHGRLAGDRPGSARAWCRSQQRGYGSALMGGIAAARGRYVLMGDADDSYDFLELPKFVEQAARGLRPRPGLPAGARRRAGAARRDADACTAAGATRCSRRWPGRWFRAPINDVYCGMRGFTKEHYDAPRPALHGHGVRDRDDHQVEPRTRADRRGADHAAPGRPQGARAAPADVPRRLADASLLPAVQPALAVPGAWRRAHPARAARVRPRAAGRRVFGVTFDAHTLLFASLAMLCGYQSIMFAVFTKVFAVSEGLLPPRPAARARGARSSRSRRGSLARRAAVMVVGLVLLVLAVNSGAPRASGGSTTPAPCGSSSPASPSQRSGSRRCCRASSSASWACAAGDGREPTTGHAEPAAFDAYADTTTTPLQRGVRLSGEDCAYFARERVAWVGSASTSRTLRAARCSTSVAAPAPRPRSCSRCRARERVGHRRVGRLLEAARRDHGSERVTFSTLGEAPTVTRRPGLLQRCLPSHPARRARRRSRLRAGARCVQAACSPSGRTTPGTPATRLVMRRIPFDRDAITCRRPRRASCSRARLQAPADGLPVRVPERAGGAAP